MFGFLFACCSSEKTKVRAFLQRIKITNGTLPQVEFLAFIEYLTHHPTILYHLDFYHNINQLLSIYLRQYAEHTLEEYAILTSFMVTMADVVVQST
jgi:hypothetical protein